MKQIYGLVTVDGYVVKTGTKNDCLEIKNESKDSSCCYPHTDIYRGLRRIAENSCYKTVTELKKAIVNRQI